MQTNAIPLENRADHMGNFFGCLRSRKDPSSPVEVEHRSAVVGHLLVIALRLGKKFQWDAQTEMFVSDNPKEGNAQLARKMRKPYDYSLVG